MAEPARRSPLAGFAFPTGMKEIPFLTMVNLRAHPRAGLPGPGSVRTEGERSILWLGPGEFLAVGGGPLPEGSTVDVSAARTTIELSGSDSRAVLEQGCTLDLHPRAFRAGNCAATTLARARVILWQTADDPVYRLLVACSFAGYLAAWLTDAAASDAAGLVAVSDDRPR
ncbi:MAG TPA: sarcosine oxidase subunit gamma family protein [Amycolatopsis sp.]|nr:sarcosine oxidase subunit gamma family protein [Amycolatopsis sp.]